ncbi:MAG: ATP-binding protein [Hymenobacter sp.]
MILPFKDRIALHYTLVTAALVAVVFLMVFVVVNNRVYTDLDQNLRFEAAKHLQELTTTGTELHFAHKVEWEEREHREVQVNPVFIQVSDLRGKVLDRSPNLNDDHLSIDLSTIGHLPRNAVLRDKAIRLVQLPVMQKGVPVGYLLAAISSEAAQRGLDSLEAVLLVSFPFVLLVLFGLARLLAGRSIEPVAAITATTNRITRNNLAERIVLPSRPDELHTLASAINGLLHRVEQAVAREQQFTADASHELRTPLAVLKGTLEVLVRKPRTAAVYVEQIALSIREIDRLTHLVDQLLLLARFEHDAQALNQQEVTVLTCVHDVLYRLRGEVKHKGIRVDVEAAQAPAITSDPFLVDLILDNVLSNAVKYSPAGSAIKVALVRRERCLTCVISDEGIGIRSEDLNKIFYPLYRSDALAHKEIGGTGLGLSIVAKACALLHVEVEVHSELHQGTIFTLHFPN